MDTGRQLLIDTVTSKILSYSLCIHVVEFRKKRKDRLIRFGKSVTLKAIF